MILFVEASQEQIHVIKDCLDRFSSASVQKVSLSKSQKKNYSNFRKEDATSIAKKKKELVVPMILLDISECHQSIVESR